VHAAEAAAVLHVEGRLHEMLLQGGPRPVSIPVEFQQCLGLAGVMKASFTEDAIENLPFLAHGSGSCRIAAGFRQRRAQVVIEGIARQALDEGLEIGAAAEPACVEGGVPVPEHPRGGSRCGHELEASPGTRRLVVQGDEPGFLVLGDPDDPVTDRCRPVEGQRRRPPPEPVDLRDDLLFRRPPGTDVFDIGRAEHVPVTSISAWRACC